MSATPRNKPHMTAVSSTSSGAEPTLKTGWTGSGGGNGGMDDVLKRLGNVERDVSDIRAKASGIEAVLPHLATKADVSNSALKIIGWMIGTAIALTTLAFTIARYIAPA